MDPGVPGMPPPLVVAKKRGYSRAFTPTSAPWSRYLLDRIPVELWIRVRAKAKREHHSLRYVLLQLVSQWVDDDRPLTPDDPNAR